MTSHTDEDLDAQRHEIFQKLTSWEWKQGLAAERVARIRRIVAHEQLVSAAMAPSTKRTMKRRGERIRYWSDFVQKYGWPEVAFHV